MQEEVYPCRMIRGKQNVKLKIVNLSGDKAEDKKDFRGIEQQQVGMAKKGSLLGSRYMVL